MLSAEHLALETRLVQQLIAVQQREMDSTLSNLGSIGTQAALLASCSTGMLAGIPFHGKVHVYPAGFTAFYAISTLCIGACGHVLLSTMYVCNWAPSLALNGPTGSVTRAYVCMLLLTTYYLLLR